MLDCVKNFFLSSCTYWFAFILIMFGIIISSVSMRMDQLNTIRNFVISERTKEEVQRFFLSHCRYSFYCCKNIPSTYTPKKLYFLKRSPRRKMFQLCKVYYYLPALCNADQQSFSYDEPFFEKLFMFFDLSVRPCIQFVRALLYTGYTQKNGAVSKVNKEFISHLTRAQRTPSSAATVQVSHALPAVRFSCLMRGRGAPCMVRLF